MADERVVAEAVKAAVASAFAPASGVEVFDYDDAQKRENAGTLPAIYVLVTVTPRFWGGPRAVAGSKSGTAWRVTTLAVGRKTDEVRWAAERVAAWEDTPLPVTGHESTLMTFESATPAEPDDGRQSAMSMWTFVTTPAVAA